MRACAQASALAALAVLASASLARAESPQYSLSVSEGSSTSPHFEVSGVSGYSNVSPTVAVSITRAGKQIAEGHGSNFASLSQVPQVGDVVTLQAPVGTVVGSVPYDGLPSIAPSVCTGSASFSGSRTGSASVAGGEYTVAPVIYGGYGSTNSAEAQISTLLGASFAGAFTKPLAIGETVWASETLQSPAPGGGVFSYYSETVRPVGACPVPAPVPAPVRAPVPVPKPKLSGEIVKLSGANLKRLLGSGWVISLKLNGPGKVVIDLYLEDGKLPAFASSAKHKRHKALLVGRGTATATVPGTVKLRLTATAVGRRALKHVKRARTVLITTLHSPTGDLVNLGRRNLSLHR